MDFPSFFRCAGQAGITIYAEPMPPGQERSSTVSALSRDPAGRLFGKVLAPNIVYAPVRISAEERQAHSNAWATRLRAIEPEKPIEVGEY